LVLAPIGSRWIAPKSYGELRASGKNAWCVHVVSQLHVILVVPLAFSCVGFENLAKDKAFGWDDRVGLLQGIACGYFLWDSLDAIINFTDIGFVIHGVSCLALYLLGYMPFLAYFGVRCLLWETSTFFLNIHWFMDKTGRTGSTLQLINGVVLLVVFFFVRMMWGLRMSYQFCYTVLEVYDQLPIAYLVVYGIGNVVLQVLNWFWFWKMIAALKKRFDAPESKTSRIEAQVKVDQLVNIDNEDEQ